MSLVLAHAFKTVQWGFVVAAVILAFMLLGTLANICANMSITSGFPGAVRGISGVAALKPQAISKHLITVLAASPRRDLPQVLSGSCYKLGTRWLFDNADPSTKDVSSSLDHSLQAWGTFM